MEKYVITIMRQFGSLGRPIAKKAAELLDVEFYDRDIVEKAAEKMKLSVSEVSSYEENAKSTFYRMKFPLGLGTSSIQDDIYYEQRKIINQVADNESCIIVGRCADYILKDMENAIHLYIYASYEDRLRNCVETLGMEEEDAKHMIMEVDKARDSYHRHYAGYLPSDVRYKDALINSSLLGVDGTAELIRDMVVKKFGE